MAITLGTTTFNQNEFFETSLMGYGDREMVNVFSSDGTSLTVRSTREGGNVVAMRLQGRFRTAGTPTLTVQRQPFLASSVIVETINATVAAPSAVTMTGTAGSGTVGTDYSYVPTITGGSGQKRFFLSSGTLPAGLSINPANGAITGRPAQGATSASGLVVSVTDASGTYAGTSFSIVISGTGATAKILIAIGQSNILRLYLNAKSQMEAGLNAVDGSPAWAFESAAADGSSLFQANATGQADPTNYWIATGGGIGRRWQEALDAINGFKAAGKSINALILNQGEGDAFYNGQSQANVDTWGAGWLTVIDSLRAAAGTSPRCYWVPMNRRGDNTAGSQVGYTNMRKKIVALCAANPTKLTLMPEMYDQDSDGGAHTTPAGYIALAPRDFRKINSVNGFAPGGGVDGPRITAVARNGATVTATIVHDGGTDVTPTTGIQGATYFIDGTEQVLGTGTRVSATSVSWTLPSNPPQGSSELFYFGYGTIPVITDYTKMLRDNQTVPLPARFAEITATVTNAGTVDSDTSTVWTNSIWNHSAADTSGQTVPNKIAAPADGQSKADYNVFLGSTSASGEGNEPTFVAASGGVPAMLTNKGTDVLQQTANTAFTRNLANDRSSSYSVLLKAPTAWNTVAYLLQCGGTAAGTAGYSIRYVPASNQFRVSSSDGTAIENGIVTVPAVQTTGYVMFTVTYNGATGDYQIFINGTAAISGTITAKKTGVATVTTFNVFNAFPSGTGFIADAMSSDIKNATAVTALLNFWQTKYGITIG